MNSGSALSCDVLVALSRESLERGEGHIAENRSSNKPAKEPLWALRNCGPNTFHVITFQHRSDFSFRREVAEICALLGHYAASTGNLLTDASGRPIGSIFKRAVLISKPEFYELHVRRYSPRLRPVRAGPVAVTFPYLLNHT